MANTEGENMAANEASKVLTVEEAGRWLGIGRSAAYDAIQRNELPHIRIGRRIVVPIKALERMLDGSSDHPIIDPGDKSVAADTTS